MILSKANLFIIIHFPFDLISHFKLHPYLMTIRYPNLTKVNLQRAQVSFSKKCYRGADLEALFL